MAAKLTVVSTGEDCESPLPDEMRRLLDDSGPFVIDGLIRQAFSMCWHLLPKHRRSAQEVIVVLREIFDRTANGLLQDCKNLALGTTEVDTEQGGRADKRGGELLGAGTEPDKGS